MFDRLAKGVDALATDTRDLLGEGVRNHSSELCEALIAQGAPAAEATSVTNLFDLDGAIGIAALAAEAKIAPRELAMAFTHLGSELGLDWAQTSAAVMSPSDPWERLLVAGLARDFQQMRLEFFAGLAKDKASRGDPVAAVKAWIVGHETEIRRFRAMIERAERTTPVAPAVLAQVASQARNLLSH